MTTGLPVPRAWITLAKSGEIILDWGDGMVQDVLTGDFLQIQEADLGRPVSDAELDTLRKNGRVESYDARNVYLRHLPEPPRPTIE
ncbi:MAG: hypothetical protein ACRDHY_10830 [Anaerolineales bacterium]